MSARGTIVQPLPRRIVYWTPAENFQFGACGSSLPLRSTATPVETVKGSGPVGVANRPRSGAEGLAMVAASASQIEKAPVVLVPGTGTGPARPSAPLKAVTKVLAPIALPAVFGMTTQLEALVTSLMITESVRPPETSRGSESSRSLILECR